MAIPLRLSTFQFVKEKHKCHIFKTLSENPTGCPSSLGPTNLTKSQALYETLSFDIFFVGSQFALSRAWHLIR